MPRARLPAAALERLRCADCTGRLAAVDRALVCEDCRREHPWQGDSFVDFMQAQADELPQDQADCWNEEAGRDEVMAAAAVSKDEAGSIFVKLPPALQQLDIAGRVVLDLGCGYGRTLLHSATRTPAPEVVFGVDISATMLQKARGYAHELGVEPVLLRAGVDRLPVADGTIDVVYSSAVLLHVPKPMAASALREARRVLRPGGRAVFEATFLGWMNPDGVQTRVMNRLGRRWARTAWVRTYTLRELRALVAASGDWSAVAVVPESRKVAPTVVGPRPLPGLKPSAKRLNARASERLGTQQLFVTSWRVDLTL